MKGPQEYIQHQVWRPKAEIPRDFTGRTKGLLYFPDSTIDIDEIHEAIEMIKPDIVVAALGEDFEQGSMNAHLIRNDTKYDTGILVHGQHGELERQVKWAVEMGFGPVVLRPANFYNGVQDKSLWQHQQQGVWQADAWYHLATGKAHSLELPGRWTVGGDFVGLGQQGTTSVHQQP